MKGAPGIWILGVGPFPLVSLPKTALAVIGERARRWTERTIRDVPTLLREIRPLEVEKVIGPAFIGYGTQPTLELASATRARKLGRADVRAIERLRTACSEEDWEHGGSHFEKSPLFGAGDGLDELAALAGYEVWNEKIAHISIVSAPERRGRGFATAAVALAARHALSAGLVPQYRTLLANAAAMGVARRLRFEEYGVSVYVRLGSLA